ncbi:aminoacyl-tRNA hydrolase [Proteobacteria bacterium 005FR1]|nr:aminoacyl-tRNA hydrolase [Proteobacteria bacterium 005FR1]
MLEINKELSIPESEFSVTAVRSQGAGGQNVNKVATAIQLRFNIAASSLPENVKARLLNLSDRRVTKDGELVLKVQDYRSQERNYALAQERLASFIRRGTYVRKARLATRPSKAAKKRRLEEKTRRGQVKAKRGKVSDF